MGKELSCMNQERNKSIVKETAMAVYHEKQSRELCALHALNNLFQDKKAFSKKELDEICQRLSPECYINPHRSILGLGNYDVNVIMAALQTKEKDTVWFDKRKDLHHLQLNKIWGFILNVPSDLRWGIVHLPIHRKHWISVRRIGSIYYNLDSKLDFPERIGNEAEVKNYMRDQIQSKDKELLLVVDPLVAQTGAWYENDTKAKGSIPVSTTSKSQPPPTKSITVEVAEYSHNESRKNGSCGVTSSQTSIK